MNLVAALTVALAVWWWVGARSGRVADPGPPLPPAAGGRGPVAVALVMELLAAALQAGSTLPDALGLVARSGATQLGPELLEVAQRLRSQEDPGQVWQDAVPELDPLRRVTMLIMEAGVPASDLLRSGAKELRRCYSREAEVRAAQLGVRLVLPLGLCALPAFIAWAVVPVVLTLAQQLL